MKAFLRFATAAAVLATIAQSVGAIPPQKQMDETARKTLEARYPMTKGFPMRKSHSTGLVEVNIYGTPAYTDEKGSFFLVGGSMLDGKANDITGRRREGLLLEGLRMMPLDTALKTVYGKGERMLVTFEDPDCSFCRKQHMEMWKDPARVNATVYTFLFPLKTPHPDAERKSRAILCSENPSKTWNDLMSGGAEPTAKPDCKAAETLERHTAIGTALGFNSTPSMVFASGLRFTEGFLTLQRLEAAMTYSQSKLPDAEAALSKLGSFGDEQPELGRPSQPTAPATAKTGKKTAK